MIQQDPCNKQMNPPKFKVKYNNYKIKPQNPLIISYIKILDNNKLFKIFQDTTMNFRNQTKDKNIYLISIILLNMIIVMT